MIMKVITLVKLHLLVVAAVIQPTMTTAAVSITVITATTLNAASIILPFSSTTTVTHSKVHITTITITTATITYLIPPIPHSDYVQWSPSLNYLWSVELSSIHHSSFRQSYYVSCCWYSYMHRCYDYS